VRIEPPLESAPELSKAPARSRRRCGLDQQGWIQVIAGLVIALIALLSSYDHISLPAGAKLQLPQQWGVWFIAASVALVAVDAQLATGSRLRAADVAAGRRSRSSCRRSRPEAIERERAARRARRQDRCALAQFEFQLHPNTTTRQRLADLISLLREYGEFA
jgi:hypothetical protein